MWWAIARSAAVLTLFVQRQLSSEASGLARSASSLATARSLSCAQRFLRICASLRGQIWGVFRCHSRFQVTASDMSNLTNQPRRLCDTHMACMRAHIHMCAYNHTDNALKCVALKDVACLIFFKIRVWLKLWADWCLDRRKDLFNPRQTSLDHDSGRDGSLQLDMCT